MSFSKAKLHRFNEETTCAPPPGKYDPKFESKVKGAIIEKSKRFTETKLESAPSVSSLDSASSCSHSHQPTFRTPQLPKKKIVTTPRSALEYGKGIVRTPVTTGLKSKKRLDEAFKYATEKNLIEQINELTRVHSSQLIDKDQELSSLYNELSEVKNSLEKAESSHEIDFNNLKQKCEMEVSEIKDELEQTRCELEKDRTEHEKIVSDFKTQIKVLDENLSNSNSLNSELEFQMAESQLSLIEMKNKYSLLETELKSAKQSMKKIAEDKDSELNALKVQFREEIEKLAVAAELNIENLSRTMEERIINLRQDLEKLKADDQDDVLIKMEDITAEVKEKVKLFDSRAAEVFNTVQNMAEKFDQKSRDLIESMSMCSKINCDKLLEYVKTSEELEAQKVCNLEQKIFIVELEDKVEVLEHEVGKLKKQCRKYEIVQSEATKTIQALSKRLFESESEVENMNENREELTLRKDALEEKIKAMDKENNLLREKISDLEVSLLKDVMEVERTLISKVEFFQKSAADETVKLNSLLEDKQKTVERMLNEIDFYKNRASELNEHKLLYEKIISDYKNGVEQMSHQFNDLEVRYNKSINFQKNLYSKLSEEYDKSKLNSKDKIQELEEKIESLHVEKGFLEKEFEEKVSEFNFVKAELNDTKGKLTKIEKEVVIMEETGFEHEKHIEELAMQLEHYTNCGVKSTQQINCLTKENEEKNEEIKKLREEMTEKELNIESLSSELLESKTYVQGMTEHVVILMGELAEKGRQIENLTHEVEMKNVTLIQVSEEYEKMKHLYEEEVKKCEEFEKDMQETQNDNEKYVDELISELVLEKERCSELMHSLEGKNTKYKNAQEKIEVLEEKQKELEEKIFLQEEKEAELIGDVSRLSDHNSDLEINLEEQIEKNKVLETEKSKINSELNKIRETVDNYREQITRLKQSLELTDKEKELESKNDLLQSSIISLNDEIFRLNNVNNALEKKINDREVQYKKIEEANRNMSSKLDDLTGEKDDLVEIVKRQWEEMELLTNEISNQQEQIDELKQLKTEKFEEVQALHQGELQNEIFALQQSLEDTQKVVIQLRSKEDDLIFKLKSAETDLNQAEADKEKYDMNIGELKTKITELESKLIAMEKRKNEYKVYAAELEQDKHKLKQEIENLSEEKEKLTEENHEESMKYASLSARITDLECQNRELESIVGPFKDQLVQFESERALLLSRNESTEKELKALALEHAKALGHQNHKQKIRHVIHLTETIGDLRKEVDKLRNENNKLRAVILEHHKESTLKRNGSVRGKKEMKENENKENGIETSPLVNKHRGERQSSPANPLKQRNVH